MYNSGLIKFREIKAQYNGASGVLTPIECEQDIPFDVKRLYYIYNVSDNKVRGKHSHKKLHQILICLSGSVDVRIENFFGEKVYTLNNPSVGLYIGPDNWREMYNFTENAVLLVLASDHYTEEDYIRDYDSFIAYSENKFGDDNSKYYTKLKK